MAFQFVCSTAITGQNIEHGSPYKRMKGRRDSKSTSKHSLGADDFKRIKGIGPAAAQKLHSAGVITFAQLADLSPSDLASLIPGLSTKRVAREGWTRQARKLTPKPARVKPGAAATGMTGHQFYATFTIELLLDEHRFVRRTRAVHIQTGDEATWAGWEGARLNSFLAERAGLVSQAAVPAPNSRAAAPPAFVETDKPSSEEQAERLAATEPTVLESKTDLQIKIGEMWLDEISAKQPLDGLPPVKHLRARIDLQLSSIPVVRSPRCFAQVLACELTNGQTAILAAGQRSLNFNSTDQQVTLEFLLPEVGRYQLLGVLLFPEDNFVGVTLGPSLTVTL